MPPRTFVRSALAPGLLLPFWVLLLVLPHSLRPEHASAAPPPAIPDFTRGDSLPEGATHDWNLGPTGARGWIYSNKLETSEARQIRVTEVEPGSPAEHLLQSGDVILGVGKRDFSHDPRTEFGKAITEAEATDGKLVLELWRNEERTRVTVLLPVLGRYSATAPFDCEKSKRILDRACTVLAAKIRQTPTSGNWIVRSYDALALLASGNEEYLPLVRQQVELASSYTDPDRRQYHSWFYGPVNMLLAEYVLATGDRSFMPQLERVTREIVRGQSECGSWGHRFVQSNGRLAGYGMMNAPGVPLVLSLALARKAGVEGEALDDAIQKGAQLLRFYVGKGSIPYGDHHPWMETHDDNGKNGCAAILFNLLGDHEATEYFSRMSLASHGNERDNGHTGNYFNMLWALPAVSLSGPQATGAWLQEFAWYYDLARRWDGSFIHQGPPQSHPDSYHRWDCTGPYLLAFAQPLGKLQITGCPKSFAPQLTSDNARDIVTDGKNWGSRTRLAGYAKRSLKEIVEGLKSWSPVVRERSAMELAKRKGDLVPRLIEQLGDSNLHSRLGACQALFHLKERSSPAIPALRKILRSDHLWLRIKAAEAIANSGTRDSPAIPDLLALLARPASSTDPRGMEQRFLSFALFNRRDGVLGRSLDGVDQEALRDAVRAGLKNPDGRARESFESVYRNLPYEEIRPLLPAIYQAIVEPAPSGIMFADGIRLSGIEFLARHHIEEGLEQCVSLMDPDRWGFDNRVRRCLNALDQYGAAAKSQLPELRKILAKLESKGWKPEKIEETGLPSAIEKIETATESPLLSPLDRA